MRKPEIWRLVLSSLIPTKAARGELTSSDWRAFVERYLLPEIEAETIRFYGSMDGTCMESMNPGLDYAKPAHRLRLTSFPKHKQLFLVFDLLRLNDNEIQILCRWQGTKHSRERYELQNSIEIRDSTWDSVLEYRHVQPTATFARIRDEGFAEADIGKIEDGNTEAQNEDEEMEDSGEEQASEAESEDELQESVGFQLNQRLLAASEARARGENAPLDADWEQWMKEAAERGGLPDSSHISGPILTSYAAPIYWGHEIPEIPSDNARPQIVALQANLIPPPRYIPAAPAVAPASAPASSVPSAGSTA